MPPTQARGQTVVATHPSCTSSGLCGVTAHKSTHPGSLMHLWSAHCSGLNVRGAQQGSMQDWVDCTRGTMAAVGSR
ncbi:hypothetical protein KC359_g150 [Hortaea werneckii]|nr:hypothetical protein KC359_g150 [Hortaea werneckii]